MYKKSTGELYLYVAYTRRQRYPEARASACKVGLRHHMGVVRSAQMVRVSRICDCKTQIRDVGSG